MNTVLEGRLIRMAYQDKCPQKHNINLLLNLAGTMVLNISLILTFLVDYSLYECVAQSIILGLVLWSSEIDQMLSDI